MASVTLNHVYLHDAGRLGDWMRFISADPSDDREVVGTVVSYATGRRRLIVTPARSQELSVTLRNVTDPELDQLDGWAGRVLLYRDHRRRMLYGSFLSLAVSDYVGRSGYDVGLVFQHVTHPFGV